METAHKFETELMIDDELMGIIPALQTSALEWHDTAEGRDFIASLLGVDVGVLFKELSIKDVSISELPEMELNLIHK